MLPETPSSPERSYAWKDEGLQFTAKAPPTLQEPCLFHRPPGKEEEMMALKGAKF